MASENNQDEWKKSVEGVIGHVQQFLDADPTRNFTPSFVSGMLNRFRDAHNREVAELKDKSCKYAQKDGGCTAEDKSFQRTVELEREVAELRECLKETINAAADAMWWKRGCDKTRNVCTNCSEKDKTFPCPVKRWLKALEGGSYAGADCAISAVRNSDMRLAHYYLSMHRGMLENMRLGYMKRFEDSGREFTNERAKADYCQCDINTVDGWLERHKEHRVDESKVNHLNGDYSTKKVIKF